MKKSWIWLLALVLVASSCKRKDAFNFSESIVAIDTKLGTEIEKVQPEVERLIKADERDSLIRLSTRMETMVDESLVKLNALKIPSVPEADQFHKESVRYFGHIKGLYTSYRNFAEETTDSTRMAAAVRIQEVEQNLTDVINSMQQAQQKFAKANGFKIE
ncbi:MAG: hypothetical protein ACK4E0_18300 [Chitinophagaceae bacterium]